MQNSLHTQAQIKRTEPTTMSASKELSNDLMTELIPNPRNLTMLTDFYELTMSNGYLMHGIGDRIAVFDMFFRKIPNEGGLSEELEIHSAGHRLSPQQKLLQ